MSLSKTYKTDIKKEIEGIEIVLDNCPNDDGTFPTFVIGRMSKSNKPYQAALSKSQLQYQRELHLKIDVSQKLEKSFKEIFCHYIIKDWRNVPLSDVTGNETDEGYATFSSQLALQLFDNLPELYDKLYDDAGNMALFSAYNLEETAKN